MTPEERRAAMAYFIRGLALSPAANETMANRMELFAELMAEASTIIETLPPVVVTALQVRFALADELYGAALLARDEAKALAPKFEFKAAPFVQPGYEQANGAAWSAKTMLDLSRLRAHYPELAHWGNLALVCAFGEFSQDVLEVSWDDWTVDARDERFLNYCCWRQKHGDWTSGAGAELAQSSEWKTQ
jgi:hypothetical protein